MDIKNMENFIAICENDYNITRTGEKLHVSQPALSKMINLIENEFGIDIFIKDRGRFVGLTGSGKILLDSFREIVGNYNHMKYLLMGIDKTAISTVKIGISPYVLEIIFGENINEICNDHDCKIEFVEAMGDDLFAKFLNKEFDILILLSENAIRNLKYYSERIVSYDYVAIMNRSHPLAEKTTIQWRDLNDIKIAIPPHGNQTYSHVTTQLSNEMVWPSYIFKISSSRVLINMPVKDDIIAILPKIFYDRYNQSKDVIALPFEKPKQWNLDMYILKENKEMDSEIFKVFEKIKKLTVLHDR